MKKGLDYLKIIDLSHTIYPGMPVYPGTETPVFQTANTFEKDGFIEKKITLYSHTGTHIDAPAHILKGAPTLDQIDVAHFMGKAIVIDLKKNAFNGIIALEDLLQYESSIKDIDFVILNTGWSKYWGEDQYFQDYPMLSPVAAQWLTDRFNLKGIGIDAISIDGEESVAFPIHRIFLEKGQIIIENLTNLDSLSKGPFIFSALPLKTKESDGSPVRAVAIVDSNL